MEKLTIKNGEYLQPLKGFWELEKDAEHNWFWAVAHESNMLIRNPSQKSVSISLSFSLLHMPQFEARTVGIYKDGMWLQTVPTPYRYTVCMDLEPGESSCLTFEAPQELMAVEGDPRNFAFQLYDVACEVEPAYERTEELRKIQDCERDILKHVIDICDRYGIKYFMFYGSLLGAVRHHGMIPWDDDIDVAMIREDYDRFLEAAEQELEAPYFLQTWKTDKECFFGGYAKVRNSNTTALDSLHENRKSNAGIWIDILPIDKVFLDLNKRKRQLETIEKLQKMIYIKLYGKTSAIAKEMPMNEYQELDAESAQKSYEVLCGELEKAIKSASDDETIFFSSLAQYKKYYERQFYTLNEFENVCKVKFDNLMVNIPEKFHHITYLHVGREFMTYPPIQKRVQKHLLFWDSEKSYQWYREGHSDKKRNVVLFGLNEESECYWQENHLKENIVFVVDDNEEVWGRMWHDAVVISPDTYKCIKEKISSK